MDLDRIQIVLRQRRIHEAIDLGLRIHQRWSAPVYRAWCATVLPAWFLILAASHAIGALWVGVLLIWGLKPLWERVPLFVISRAIFGATPTVREVWRNLSQICALRSLPGLLWYRFSPGRSMLMPVGQLEQLTGKRRTDRRRVLGQGTELAGAVGLLAAGIALELTLFIGIQGFVLMMLPDSPGFDAETLVDAFDSGTGPLWATTTLLMGWLLALSTVEPIYVASGFALYLNRRTVLEGWDVELAFRRLATRLTQRSRVIGVLFFAAWMSSSGVVEASQSMPVDEIEQVEDGSVAFRPTVDLVTTDQDYIEASPGPSPETAGAIDAATERVFLRPEFSSTSEVTEWVQKDDLIFAGMDLTQLIEWLHGLFDWNLWPDAELEDEPESSNGWWSGLNITLEMLVWALVAAQLCAATVWMYRRRRTAGRGRRGASPIAAADPLASGALREKQPVTAPAATVPQQVWTKWVSGDTDAALALLYNSALAELATGTGLELDAAWTEGDCARIIQEHVGGPPARYFKRVVRARTVVSYAHRRPEDQVIKGLCEDWSQLGVEP